MLNFMFPYPEDSGGGDDDEAGKTDDGGDDNAADKVEQEEARKRLAFEARQKKRKKTDVLEEELGGQRESINQIIQKLDDLNKVVAASEKNKVGRPKKEENQLQDMVEALTETFTTKLGEMEQKVSQEVASLKTTLDEDRKAQTRRDFLMDLGVTLEFVKDVGDGIINIPDSYLDDFEKLDALITRRGGYAAQNGKIGTETKKSVHHREGADDTNALHTDKQTKVGLDETLETVNKGIDAIIDKAKNAKEGEAAMSKDDLTALFKLAEDADGIIAGK